VKRLVRRLVVRLVRRLAARLVRRLVARLVRRLAARLVRRLVFLAFGRHPLDHELVIPILMKHILVY
jgi:hypothetical protein